MNRLAPKNIVLAILIISLAVNAALLRAGAPVALAEGDQHPESAAIAAAQGTTFSYQGQLKKGGAPANTTCSFQFGLWDAQANGTQRGSTQTLNNIAVSNGLFTVSLDFGNQFSGEARWLQTAVKCTGDAAYTTLAPRQALDAVPYALGLRPGAVISTTTANVPAIAVGAPAGNANALVATGNGNGFAVIYGEDQSSNGGYGVFGKSTKGSGVYGLSQTRAGVLGESASSDGVWGNSTSGNGVAGTTRAATGSAVVGINLADGANAIGVKGVSTDGPGVNGASTTGNGVKGTSEESAGVYGVSVNGSGVYGSSANSNGVYGQTSSSLQPGVRGVNNTASGIGVRGDAGAANSIGVRGEANASGGVGVWGQSNANTGVYGLSTNGIGVWGQSTNGPAMRADGPTVQARDKGGWLKAMAYVRSDGAIMRCYNGVTGPGVIGCGFSAVRQGDYSFVVDFGFAVSDRYVTVTQVEPNASVTDRAYNTFAFVASLSGNTTVVRSGWEQTQNCGGIGQPFCGVSASDFMILVY